MHNLWLVGHLCSRMTMMSLNTVVEDNVPKWNTPGRSQCIVFSFLLGWKTLGTL